MAAPPARRGAALLLAATAICAFLPGCATYSSSFDVIERELSARQYDAALREIDKQAGSVKDRVLHLLNKGMVLRMKREFAASNVALEAAKAEMERLYAASVSENTLSFLVNDATVSYAGDDYEQVLVHLYMALNYLELGQLGDARVEALQVDIKLREIAESVPGDKFTEDAFSRYLTGLIYEELGEWSDAMIAYRKAYDAYKKYRANYGLAIPGMLKYDLLRLALRQGLMDEARQYQREFGLSGDEGFTREHEGELVFVLNNGLAPVKRERVVVASPPAQIAVDAARQRVTSTAPVFVNIALPYYEARRNRVRHARISVAGRSSSSEIMEDIDAIAKASLDARMPAITARSIARAVAKGAVQRSVDRAANNGRNDAAAEVIGSVLVRVAAIATERADTRSWLTLPSNIQLARLSLPPGSYTVTVDLLGAAGQVVATQEYTDVVISNRRKTYLTQHWVSD